MLRGDSALRTVTEPQLRAITIPLLAVVGEADEWARADAERMAGVMANVKVTIVPGADHLSAAGHPLFLREIMRFLAMH